MERKWAAVEGLGVVIESWSRLSCEPMGVRAVVSSALYCTALHCTSLQCTALLFKGMFQDFMDMLPRTVELAAHGCLSGVISIKKSSFSFLVKSNRALKKGN